MEKRTSCYLEVKAMALDKALDFFLADIGSTIKAGAIERRMVFLAQIEFWDWEMSELIYSFVSFAERAELWDDWAKLKDHLLKMGVCLSVRNTKNTDWHKKWEKWQEQRGYSRKITKVEPPFPLLEKIIEKWNMILDDCEKSIIRRGSQEAVEKWGVQIIGLDKYIKKIPSTEAT